MTILENLYYGNIDELSRKSNVFLKDVNNEILCYDKLMAILNEEQKQLFEEYIQAYENKMDNFACEKYVNGFKTGFLIALESTKIKFPN